MNRQNQAEPEPLAQIVFIEFEPAEDPDNRDIYISFNGYTAGYSAIPMEKRDTMTVEELSEGLHYYIKSPEGNLLRFDFEYYGGFKEIEPGSDPNAEKLDWILYSKEKFLEQDQAEQVMSFSLYRDKSKGRYRIRKTVLTKELKGDVVIEKPATRKDRELFENAFSEQIKHLYSILHLHDVFAQAGGVAIFKDTDEGFIKIGDVEKQVLVQAGIKDPKAERDFMNQYLDNFIKENGLEGEDIFYLPSDTQLIPNAFLEKLMVEVEKTGENGETYTHREIEVKPGNYHGALNDAEVALHYAFGNIVEKPLKDIAKQGKIAKVNVFDQILNTTAQQPFLQHYTPDKSQYQNLKPVRVSRHSDKNTIFNYVALKTDVELDFFEQLVLSAFRTWKNLYPEEAPTFLDICNTLHHPKGKRSSLDSRSKLIKDVAESFDSLRTTLCKIDFRLQAETYKNNKNFQRYLNSGGSGIISFPFVSGIRKPIRTANGEVLDGIVPDGEQADRLLDAYIKMTGQIRTVTGDALINPLRATREDLMIFHYLLFKACSMPYFHSQISLFSEKQRYLALSKEKESEPVKDNTEFNSIWKKDPEPEALPDNAEVLADKMLELENKAQKKDLTISIDTVIEDLKLNKTNAKPAQIKKRRNTVKTKIEKVLDYWKSTGLISGYETNKRRNGRGVQSYTLSFFNDMEG